MFSNDICDRVLMQIYPILSMGLTFYPNLFISIDHRTLVLPFCLGIDDTDNVVCWAGAGLVSICSIVES